MNENIDVGRLRRKIEASFIAEWTGWITLLMLVVNSNDYAWIALVLATVCKFVLCWHIVSWAHLTNRTAWVWLSGMLFLGLLSDPLIPLFAARTLRRMERIGDRGVNMLSAESRGTGANEC